MPGSLVQIDMHEGSKSKLFFSIKKLRVPAIKRRKQTLVKHAGIVEKGKEIKAKSETKPMRYKGDREKWVRPRWISYRIPCSDSFSCSIVLSHKQRNKGHLVYLDKFFTSIAE